MKAERKDWFHSIISDQIFLSEIPWIVDHHEMDWKFPEKTTFYQ